MPTRRDVLTLLAGTPFLHRAAFLATLPLGAMPEPVTDLARAFASPPNSTRPYVLWMWMGCNISERGITRDLEAMREAGIGGATIYSLADTVTPWSGVILKSPTPEIVTFTEPWWKLIRFAASECRRLGLELLLHNCAGYATSGGTWITPELSMQELIWSEQRVSGGEHVEMLLPRAKVDLHPHQDWPTVYIPAEGKFGVPLVEARGTYYRDVAVLALPAEGTIAMDQIIDLSQSMNDKGELSWTAPAGEWKIYRFGHTTTGAMVQPAQWDAMGLECDKMNVEAVTFHCRHVLDAMKRHVGDFLGNPGLSTLYFDSYEAGIPNWTPKMREEFRARRGYELTPYLAVLAGRKVVSDVETARFKKDFSRTIADLYRDYYWGTPRTLAHEYGLQFVAEPYDGPWETPEVVGLLDHANMEFWTHNNKYSPVDNRTVIDTAHRLGQRIIGAEAFTTAPELARWDEHPAWLKPIGDAAFCDGVNRFNIHHFVQQPWGPQYQPGNAMGRWGIHLGRYQTWWEPGKAWLTYLWRCQTLLQCGNFIPASPGTSATFSVNSGSPEMQSIHRLFGKEHVYFIANLARTAGDVYCTFPLTGLQPEIWDPVWGTIEDVHGAHQSEAHTAFDLRLAPAQSAFIIFRRPWNKDSAKRRRPVTKLIEQISGPWQVHFDPKLGGPGMVEFDTLQDWTVRSEAGIRFFSGTALYKNTLIIPEGSHGKLILDLGAVMHLAAVTVNGKRLGVLWTAPWAIDITSAVVTGRNTIEIAITNVWANRLIGDELEPADVLWEKGDTKMKGGYFLKELPDWFLKNEARPSQRRVAFTTWNYFYDKDVPLTSSGLFGPVQLLSLENNPS